MSNDNLTKRCVISANCNTFRGNTHKGYSTIVIKLVHTDLCWPITPVSWNNKQYFLNFTDVTNTLLWSTLSKQNQTPLMYLRYMWNYSPQALVLKYKYFDVKMMVSILREFLHNIMMIRGYRSNILWYTLQKTMVMQNEWL